MDCFDAFSVDCTAVVLRENYHFRMVGILIKIGLAGISKIMKAGSL